MSRGFLDDDPSPKDQETIDITARIETETSAAYCLDVGEENMVWLPKSQVEWDGKKTFTVPLWLATEKGLV